MKIGRVLRSSLGAEPRLVLVDVDRRTVTDLRIAEVARLVGLGSSTRSAERQAELRFPGSLTTALESSEFGADLRRVADTPAAVEAASVSWDEVEWLAPADPPRYRDFMSFEQHHLTSARLMGGDTPNPVIYSLPTYYKGNHLSMVGQGAEVEWPGYCDFMDFELELGFVVGSAGKDLTPAEAELRLFGVTILNDFSARDRQLEEMAGSLGPAKGKDFATAIGPWITTVDELDLLDLRMSATVNGELWAEGSSGSAMWSASELIAYVSTCEALVPGEILGSGTLGGGCGVEVGRRIIPGDVVTLTVSGIGTLENRLGHPTQLRWEPPTRVPGRTIDGGVVAGPTLPLPPRTDAAPPPVVLDADGRRRVTGEGLVDA